jgi:hypothetical protein
MKINNKIVALDGIYLNLMHQSEDQFISVLIDAQRFRYVNVAGWCRLEQATLCERSSSCVAALPADSCGSCLVASVQ